ncbi:MAG: PaaI family thioesterase [Chloroflexi bacterium]|nr:PaaI family thioesterase [Chloroflexota bacterium]
MEKQPNSSMCFVCGRDNPIGLRMQFFSDGDGCVYADYEPHAEHQGYPGVMHGGLVTAMLDELIGRTAIASDLWCMTAKLEVRFRKPVPIDAPLKLKGEIKNKTGRLIEGYGEIRLPDGTLAAEAHGTYIRIPDAQLDEYKRALGNWRVDD